jgi:hypothetical protein
MKMNKAVALIIALFLVISLNGCARIEHKVTATESPTPPSTESSAPASDIEAPYPNNDAELYNENVQFPEGTVLVNEQDNNKQGLFYLGMSKDEVRSVLEDNRINFVMQESDTGEANFLFEFYLFDDSFALGLANDSIYSIGIYGDSPVDATSTQSGLNLGDTLEKMVELYGSDYKVVDEGYVYVIGDHSFLVRFKSNAVTGWEISTYMYDNRISVDDVHGNNYYDFLLVETYIKSRIRAINQNNFDSIAEYLDEDGDIYQSEKQYINDCASQGIQHKLLNFTHEDIKEVSANLYDLVYSFKFEEISLDNTKTKKEMRQVFTVFDDGDTLKIIDINDFSDPWIGDYSFSEQNVSYRFTINKSYGNYRATFYIDRYNIEQQFKTIIVGDENSIDIIFNFYSSETTINPYEKGDVLLTLKKENDEIITYWGKMQPMLSSNCESGSVYFIKVS